MGAAAPPCSFAAQRGSMARRLRHSTARGLMHTGRLRVAPRDNRVAVLLDTHRGAVDESLKEQAAPYCEQLLLRAPWPRNAGDRPAVCANPQHTGCCTRGGDLRRRTPPRGSAPRPLSRSHTRSKLSPPSVARLFSRATREHGPLPAPSKRTVGDVHVTANRAAARLPRRAAPRLAPTRGGGWPLERALALARSP